MAARVATHCGEGHGASELAPEKLPWDASSRKPPRTSSSFDPGEAELGTSPRAPMVSQSAVPSLVAVPLDFGDTICTFLLSIPRFLLHSGATGGSGELAECLPMPMVTFILNRLAGGCGLWPEGAN